MAAIETTQQIMNKIRVTVARLGITTIRNLHVLFAANDKSQSQQIFNEEFVGVLMKGHIHLSKYDEASVVKAYKVDDLNVNYIKFMDALSPPLSEEREKVVNELFSLIQKRSNQENAVILYSDLKQLFDAAQHPDVKMGRLVKNAAQHQMEGAFDGIQNAKDEISLDKFKQYFRGISSGYPFRLEAFTQFVRGCWCSLFVNLNDTTESEKSSQQFVIQIEAMLADKTRQKIKGTENECNTLLRQFKQYDLEKLGFVTYDQLVHVLESFCVLAPETELRAFFAKWSKPQQQTSGLEKNNRLWYRPFVQSLFETY